MATVTWYIKKNADAPATLASLGVTGVRCAFRLNGLDEVTFTQSSDWLAAPLWPDGTRVALIRRVTDGGVDTDTCVFVGTVDGIPRAAQGAGAHDLSYRVTGPSYDLMRCDYSQEWTYTKEDGTTATIYEPTVVLGEDNNGTRLASGAVISHAAAYAVSRGVQIDIGTVAAGVQVPLDERDNIKVWDAVVAMLSYTPDYGLWWDYDHQVEGVYVPALNVTAPADMPVVSKALSGEGAAVGAAFTPRTDLQTPGIQIIYRWAGEYDGRTVKRRVVEQAGNVSSFKRVSLVFDLEGARSVFISQDIESEAYPADWTSAAGKAMLVKLVPSLASMPDADWDVVSVTRPGSAHAYGYRLLSGAVPSWTGKHSERDTFTVRISYEARSTATDSLLQRGEKIFNFTAVSTDADTDTYRKQTEWVEAEPVPEGLAAALLASWNRLHYDGSVTFHEQEASFDVLPGKRLSGTGGLAEWETMSAIVQDVTVDLARGTTLVRTGTCGRLNADNLLAVYRAARGRRFSTRRLGRDDGDATDGNAVEGAKATPNDNGSDGTPPCLMKYFAVEHTNASSILHRVEIDPGDLRNALDTQENTAQLFKLRPVEIVKNDGPDANGDGRLAVYKGYALTTELTLDRYEQTTEIPEAAGDGYTGANSVDVSVGKVISLLGDAANAAGLYCAYFEGDPATPVRVWATPSGSVIIAASGAARIVRLEGDSDAPTSGTDQLFYVYDRSPASEGDKKRKWIKLGTNGGLVFETFYGATGFRLKGTTDTAPGANKVYGTNSSGTFGWQSTITLTMSS